MSKKKIHIIFHFIIQNMCKNQSQIFFKIESDVMTQAEMNTYARNLINEVNPNAKIFKISSNPKEVQFRVISSNNEYSEKLIHEYNYRQFDKCKTLAMWFRKYGNFEVIIMGAPENTTRREYFLAMEKFGPISRVSPCRVEPGTAWVEFINESSAIAATLSLEKIGDSIPFIAAVNDNPTIVNKYRQKCINQYPPQESTSSFENIGSVKTLPKTKREEKYSKSCY